MLSQLVFSVSHDCPVTCKFCVTESGPHNGPHLDSAFMIEAIREVEALGKLRSVIFTGGEPLMRLKDVRRAIAFAASHSLWTRIVTNSFWATAPNKAKEVLASLREAGLSEINLSCDDLHQANIPLARVYNAFWAARDLGIPTLLGHRSVPRAKITIAFLEKYLGVSLTEFKPGEKNCDFDLYSTGPTVPVGFGAGTLSEKKYIVYPKCDAPWQGPCASVLSSIIVSPTRALHMCCGMVNQNVPELRVGQWGERPLAELVYEANVDLIANWLVTEGPYGMMRFIQLKEPAIEFRGRYVNHCHLCNDILTRAETRAVLLRHAGEKAAEIAIRRGLLEAIRPRESDVDSQLPARSNPILSSKAREQNSTSCKA